MDRRSELMELLLWAWAVRDDDKAQEIESELNRLETLNGPPYMEQEDDRAKYLEGK